MMREPNEAGEELPAAMLALSFDSRPASHVLCEPLATSELESTFDDGSGARQNGGNGAPGEPEQAKGLPAPEFDAETLFSTDVRLTSTLSRGEEDALARRIVRARNCIRGILRGARNLSRAALADFGRGLLAPEEGFRETEVVAILNYAEAALLNRHGAAPATGMTRGQLRAFVAGLSAALTTYRTLRDRMVVANLRLVILFARRHRHPRLSFLDFVQEGTLGLIRAIEKYEPNRNVKFSTYAVYWIWQQIARAADTQGALIRTPVHWNQVRRRIGRELWQAETEEGCRRSVDAWALENGIDRERLATMTRPIQCISTDAPLSDDDDRSLEDQLRADVAAPEEHVMQADLRQRLEALVEQLPKREAEIMRRRFGLSDSDSETLEAVGEHFGVSRERIRQLEGRALRHLRELCTAEGLQEYLG
jgi:RNA polymerase sigma factor (sigma-70 family)